MSILIISPFPLFLDLLVCFLGLFVIMIPFFCTKHHEDEDWHLCIGRLFLFFGPFFSHSFLDMTSWGRVFVYIIYT